jgi:hypothetical protein
MELEETMSAIKLTQHAWMLAISLALLGPIAMAQNTTNQDHWMATWGSAPPLTSVPAANKK